MTALEEFKALLNDEACNSFVLKLWRVHIVSALAERPQLVDDLTLLRRQQYLVRNLTAHAANTQSKFGALCWEVRDASHIDSLAHKFELPIAEHLTSRQWLDWGFQSLPRGDTSVSLYCLCNYWSFPSEEGTVDSQDDVAFRLLRFLVAKLEQVEPPIRFSPRAQDIRNLSEDAWLRREIQELLDPRTGLQCVANGWKKQIWQVIKTRPISWIAKYRAQKLDIILRYIDDYTKQSYTDGEREFAALCERLRPGDGVAGLSPSIALATARAYAQDYSLWFASATEAMRHDKPAEALYCAAAYLAAPAVWDDDSSDCAELMELILTAIPRLHGRDSPDTADTAATKYPDITWTNDATACHPVICPVCRRGGKLGSGKYGVELRAYFGSGTAESLDRRLLELRIKCGGGCTVGTKETSGLYLVERGVCVNWSRQRTAEYLKDMGSPLAARFEPGGQFD